MTLARVVLPTVTRAQGFRAVAVNSGGFFSAGPQSWVLVVMALMLPGSARAQTRVLESGVAVSNVQGAEGTWTDFIIDVPAGASRLVVQTSSGSGDADLYTRHGDFPELGTYDCRSWNFGNSESYVETNATSGTWYISLRGYTAFSGLRITATVTCGWRKEATRQCRSERRSGCRLKL